jgi:hypothetical protein
VTDNKEYNDETVVKMDVKASVEFKQRQMRST